VNPAIPEMLRGTLSPNIIVLNTHFALTKMILTFPPAPLRVYDTATKERFGAGTVFDRV
jgi:hypothetical protein